MVFKKMLNILVVLTILFCQRQFNSFILSFIPFVTFIQYFLSTYFFQGMKKDVEKHKTQVLLSGTVYLMGKMNVFTTSSNDNQN